MTIKAVLWDMDGTLIDSEHLHISSLGQAMAIKGMQVPDDLYLFVNGMAAEEVYDWIKRDFGFDEAFDDWIKVKYEIYMRRLDEVRPFKDAISLWDRLNSAGIKQAVVSNSDRLIVDANLNHLGLESARQITVSRNDVRDGKPYPEPYLRAAWLLNVEPSECIVLEDSPTGAIAGVAAGMATFMVPNTPSETPKGVNKLTSFTEIDRLCGP